MTSDRCLNKYETAILKCLNQLTEDGQYSDLDVHCSDGHVVLPGLLLAAISPLLVRCWDPGKHLSDMCLMLPDMTCRSISNFVSLALSPTQRTSQEMSAACHLGKLLGISIEDPEKEMHLKNDKCFEIESWEIKDLSEDDDEAMLGDAVTEEVEIPTESYLPSESTVTNTTEKSHTSVSLQNSNLQCTKSKVNPEISLESSGSDQSSRLQNVSLNTGLECQQTEQDTGQEAVVGVKINKVPTQSKYLTSTRLDGKESQEDCDTVDDMQDPGVRYSEIDSLCGFLEEKSFVKDKKNLEKKLLSLSKVNIDSIGEEVLSSNFSDQEGRLVCLVCYKIMDPNAYQTYRSHMKEHDNKQLDKVFIIMPEVDKSKLIFGNKMVSDKEDMKIYLDEDGDLVCIKCSKKFNIKEKQNLKRHLQYHMLRDKKHVYACNECNRQFNNPSNLSRHIKQMHEKQIFRCLHCDFEDKRKEKLENHMLSIHKDKGWIYDDVPLTKGLENQELGELGVPLHSLSEESVKTPSIFKCSGCHFRRRTRESIVEHIKTMHENKVFTVQKVSVKPWEPRRRLRCEVCDTEVSSQNQLIQHKVRVHNLDVDKAGLYQNKCEVCGTACATKSGLRSHERTHQEKKFTCSFCEKPYFNLHQLREHIQKGFCKEENRRCKICNKTFYDKKRLDIHMKIHNNIREFKCEQCGKEFTQKRTLTEHLLIHSDSRNFECKICLKKFVQQNHLKYHLSSQHPSSAPGEAKHKCGQCSKAFPFEYLLRKHQRVHGKSTNNSSLQCERCSTWFSTPILLKEHQQQKKCPAEQTIILQDSGQITSLEISQLASQIGLNHSQLSNLSDSQLTNVLSKPTDLLSKIQVIQDGNTGRAVQEEVGHDAEIKMHDKVANMAVSDGAAVDIGEGDNSSSLQVCDDISVVYETSDGVVAGEITIDVAAIAGNTSLDLE